MEVAVDGMVTRARASAPSGVAGVTGSTAGVPVTMMASGPSVGSLAGDAAFGFSFDATQVANEITACTNVVNKYHKALVCGALDPETTLPQFNSELKDAGIDAIIEEKQAQLDAWLAEQK